MKKIILIILLFSLSNSNYSQSFDIEDIIEKRKSETAFKKALATIEEKPNRFFLKPGKKIYIEMNVFNDFLFEDNNGYADVELKDDVLTIFLYRYSYYKDDRKGSKFDINDTYHQYRTTPEYTRFNKLDGDVYVVQEHKGKLDSESDYVLYNPQDGLYFHYNNYHSYHKVGGGFYKKSKKETISQSDLKEEENNFETYNNLFKKAVSEYLKKQKNLVIKNIIDSPDEGVTNSFHQINVGELLFGNNVSEQNKYSASSYKSKFTLDEGINVCAFLDKGLSKFIDTSANPIKENIDDLLGNKVSEFNIKLTLANGKTKTSTVYIENPSPHKKTSGVFNLVLKNASMGNNHWIKDFLPKTIEGKELSVLVELYIKSNPSNILASGSFVYLPKVGAKVPYGYSCNLPNDVSNFDLEKIKPRLKEVASYNIGRFNKKENRGHAFVDLAITSNWIEEVSMYGLKEHFFYVKILCKDSEGNLFVFNDRFISYDKSEVGYFDSIANSRFNVNYCDN